jgi:hypothetical protein
MNRFTNVLVALTLAAGLAACGGGYSGFLIPIESELNPWVAPEADELADEDEEEEEYEEYVDEEEEDAAPAKPAKPAPAPAPAPAKK